MRIKHKSKTVERLIIHNITLAEDVSKVYITLSPEREKQEFEIFIAYDASPTDTFYNQKLMLNSELGYSSVIEPVEKTHMMYVGVMDGKYSSSKLLHA